MLNRNLKSTARMAIALGIFLPVAETIRRVNQLSDPREFFNWFDDYILGAILILSAVNVLKERKNASAYLIAAWGIAMGGVSLSFLGQFSYYESASGDPGIFSTTLVAAAKGLILLYVIVGLAKAIKGNATET